MRENSSLVTVVGLAVLFGAVLVLGRSWLDFPTASVAAEARPPVADVSGALADRQPLEATPEGDRARTPSLPPPLEPDGDPGATMIVGRCVDWSGAPLAQVLVGPRGSARCVRSDREGRFRLTLVAEDAMFGEQTWVEFQHEDLYPMVRTVTLEAGTLVDLADVELPKASRVRGRVVDATGAPVRGAHVLVHAAGEDWSSVEGPSGSLLGGAETDAEGGFEVRPVPLQELRVWAGARGHLWTRSEPFEVLLGGEVDDVLLVLEPLPGDRRLVIEVLDPDGQPVVGGQVRFHADTGGNGEEGKLTTDAHGRATRLLDRPALHDVLATAPSGTTGAAFAADLEPGDTVHVLRLPPKRTVQVQVLDERGRAVPDADVRRFHVDTRVQPRYRALEWQGDSEPGWYALELPATRFRLQVRAEGYRSTGIGPLDPERVGDVLVVQLEAVTGVTGRVTVGGEPIAGARVTLHPLVEDGRRLSVGGFPCRSGEAVAASETDADGTFVLQSDHEGAMLVRAELEGFAPTELGPHTIDPIQGLSGLELELTRGGAIEGRVLHTPAGRSGDILVGLSRGDGFGFTIRPGEDGGFRAEGLTPGPWLVVPRYAEVNSRRGSSGLSGRGDGPVRLPWSCEVRDGETTSFDLDLAKVALSSLSGRLLLGGQSPKGWHLGLYPREEQSFELISEPLADDGRFELDLEGAGRVQLDLSGRAAGHEYYFHQVLRLEPGANTVDFEVPAGELRLDLAGVELSPGKELALSWSGGGRSLFVRLHRGTATRLEVPFVPAGEVSLSYTTADGPQKKAISVEAGTVHDVALR